MSLGTLYTRPFNPRSPAILAVAKADNLNLEIVTITSSQEAPDYYRKLNRLAKVPTFVGSDGYVLSECIAIALYITSLNEKTTLLGNSKQDYASIVRWMSFANSEILPSLGGWFNPLIGRVPFNKQAIENHMASTLQKVQVLETHLSTNTFLVGERLSLADLFVTGVVAGGFMCFFDKAWRANHPAVTRWFELVYAQPIYADVAGKPILVEKAMPNVPPKKGGMGPPPPATAPPPPPSPQAAASLSPASVQKKEKDGSKNETAAEKAALVLSPDDDDNDDAEDKTKKTV